MSPSMSESVSCRINLRHLPLLCMLKGQSTRKQASVRQSLISIHLSCSVSCLPTKDTTFILEAGTRFAVLSLLSNPQYLSVLCT